MPWWAFFLGNEENICLCFTSLQHLDGTYTWNPSFQLHSQYRCCWGRLNIKMSSYQYMDSHYKDNTVSRPYCLYNGNLIHGKTVFIMKRIPGDAEAMTLPATSLTGLSGNVPISGGGGDIEWYFSIHFQDDNEYFIYIYMCVRINYCHLWLSIDILFTCYLFSAHSSINFIQCAIRTFIKYVSNRC